MRILLTGGSGQVGWELQRTLSPLAEVVAPAREELDLSDLEGLRRAVHHIRPEVVVNAAAYTDVDRAEREQEIAHRINAEAPAVLAEEARRIGACLVHYSTDYVFDGRKGEPYTEEDTPNPLNAYGRSKLEGEQAVQQVGGAYVVLRTSWVYSLRRPCFVTRILESARTQPVIRVVADQVGSPTWCRSLAEASAMLLAMMRVKGMAWLTEHSGLYHLACGGASSRLEWARTVLEFGRGLGDQAAPELVPLGSEDFPSAALRPGFSALASDRFAQVFALCLPGWREALRQALSCEQTHRAKLPAPEFIRQSGPCGGAGGADG